MDVSHRLRMFLTFRFFGLSALNTFFTSDLFFFSSTFLVLIFYGELIIILLYLFYFLIILTVGPCSWAFSNRCIFVLVLWFLPIICFRIILGSAVRDLSFLSDFMFLVEVLAVFTKGYFTLFEPFLYFKGLVSMPMWGLFKRSL